MEEEIKLSYSGGESKLRLPRLKEVRTLVKWHNLPVTELKDHKGNLEVTTSTLLTDNQVDKIKQIWAFFNEHHVTLTVRQAFTTSDAQSEK